MLDKIPPSMSEQVDLTTIPISPDGDEVPTASIDSAADVKTVFHDKDNFNVKHPLANRWTLWFTKPASGKVRDSGTGCLVQNMVANY